MAPLHQGRDHAIFLIHSCFQRVSSELKDAGLPKRRILQALLAYHAQLLERGMAALDVVSSDEEDTEPQDERREEGGQGNAAIEPEPVGISAQFCL